MLIKASDSLVDLLGRRIWAIEQLLAAFEEHRDSMYECLTDALGQYDTDDDRKYIADMDRIIDNARRELGMLQRRHVEARSQVIPPAQK